jgi:hypothetical protein
VASWRDRESRILVYRTNGAYERLTSIAMIFPSMTIVKVIAVQIVGLLSAREQVQLSHWRLSLLALAGP